MSLAWMINKYDFIVPIPGSRKLDRLQSNFEAGNVELSQEEVKTIVFRYIFIYYNRIRLYTGNPGYLPPSEYRIRDREKTAA